MMRKETIWLQRGALGGLVLALLGAALPQGTAAEDVEALTVLAPASIDLVPSQRRGARVLGDERNPFADRVPDLKPLEGEESGKTEDDRIRIIFSELTVSGVSRGPGGLRVLMGDLILEKGYEVPPLLENQASRIMVTGVSENEVELSWLDPESGEVTPKKLLVAYDLTPSVSFVLQGQRLGKAGEGARRFGRVKKVSGSVVPVESLAKERARFVDPEKPLADGQPATKYE